LRFFLRRGPRAGKNIVLATHHNDSLVVGVRSLTASAATTEDDCRFRQVQWRTRELTTKNFRQFFSLSFDGWLTVVAKNGTSRGALAWGKVWLPKLWMERDLMVRAIFFDVGETLIDETRHWGLWADYLRVPRLTFFAVLGALIHRGVHHREIFKIFDPEFDYDTAWGERLKRGETYDFLPSDFYPDALPCLKTLKGAGYAIGISGNQPEGCEAALREAGMEADVLASSSSWGVEKPSPSFFERIVKETNLPPTSIVYVGDRYKNDIEPAYRCGLLPILIRRAPWALISRESDYRCARAVIQSLSELPSVVATLS